MKATQHARDAARIVDDDSFNLRFDTIGGPSTDFTFATNVLTTKFELKAGLDAQDWNVDWEVVTRRGKDRWTIELAIPFVVLGMPSSPTAGQKWRADFSRHRRGIDFQLEKHSARSGVTGLSDPNNYGTLEFGPVRE